ncbi:MAG: GNAT family N-acetyltransferase [Propionibacteriaceae bacterium]|nr:GNAT family N-acetyltransferase [Propionibacteriaceae bacterium]
MIQRAKHRDLLAIMQLEEAGFPANERWSEQLWREELEAGNHCVLVDRDEQGVIRGVVTGHVVADVADVDRVIVAPDSWRQGIGSALMAAIMEWAGKAGAERLLLEVDAHNEAAIALYHSFGFQTLSFRADYYGPGSDACVLGVSVALPVGDC